MCIKDTSCEFPSLDRTRSSFKTHKMKSFIVALCIVGSALAVDQVAQVLRNDYSQSPDGQNYNYAYETDQGIAGQAQGTFKVVDKDSAAVVVAGSNQYKDPKDGRVYAVQYVADENGYQPQAEHLPTPPPPQPIPDYILKSLDFIAAHSKKV